MIDDSMTRYMHHKPGMAIQQDTNISVNWIDYIWRPRIYKRKCVSDRGFLILKKFYITNNIEWINYA